MSVACLACLLVCSGCVRMHDPGESVAWRKIQFDLAQLDRDGLRGPPDGKVSVSYEFAIPDTAACRAEVTKIDPTVQLMRGSRGRIGASEGQCLCIGSTHQENPRDVLRALAELPYVERIIECHFE